MPAADPLLLALLETPSPSGYEHVAAARWREAAARFAVVAQDSNGNSFATVRPAGAAMEPPAVLLAGHLDEIGVIVTHIDEQGFVFFGPIGGWDPQVLVGQRVRLAGARGPVLGVVGTKAIHLQAAAERDRASRITDLWIDIGASSREEAEARLAVGDAGVLEQPPLALLGDRLAGRGLDNRVGAWIVLEALRRYAADPGTAIVVAAATVQEEIGLRGARLAAERIRPTATIVVDVTHAMDTPGLATEMRERGHVVLGKGPSIARGAVLSPVLHHELCEAAREAGVALQSRAYGGMTSTDADAVQIAAEGVPVALVGIPNRYMHSPSEIVSLTDLDEAATLLAAACRRITADTDFSAR